MSGPSLNSEFLARLDERLKSLKETTDAIHAEVKKTNGRVGALESWRNRIHGSWSATIIISATIGTLVGFVIKLFF